MTSGPLARGAASASGSRASGAGISGVGVLVSLLDIPDKSARSPAPSSERGDELPGELGHRRNRLRRSRRKQTLNGRGVEPAFDMHAAGHEHGAHARPVGAGDVGADAVPDGKELAFFGAAGLQL